MNQPSLSLACENCQGETVLKKNKLLSLKSSPQCKTCHHDLLPYFTQPFSSLSADVFIHNLDRQMLDSLQRLPGIDTVLRSLLRHSIELSMRLAHQGNFIKASATQLKSLYEKLEYAARILDIPVLPELYVVQDARANAYTFGVEKCSIAISSGLLDLMSDEEIISVLAHELGHIKANHVLYKTASRLMVTLADNIAQKTFGLGGIVLYPLQIALLRWDRASELSSDRASLLVVKNPLVVLRSLMKMAGGTAAMAKELNIDAFIEQAEGYEKTQDEGPLGKYIAVMSNMFNTHPFPIWRAKEIIEWVYSGDYFRIMQGKYLKTPRLDARQCHRCGAQLEAVNAPCIKCAGDKNDPKGSYGESIDKAWGNLRSWYDKNFNLPKD